MVVGYVRMVSTSIAAFIIDSSHVRPHIRLLLDVHITVVHCIASRDLFYGHHSIFLLQMALTASIASRISKSESISHRAVDLHIECHFFVGFLMVLRGGISTGLSINTALFLTLTWDALMDGALLDVSTWRNQGANIATANLVANHADLVSSLLL
jgi:hypothetical protein